jgi:hypothetical protein
VRERAEPSFARGHGSARPEVLPVIEKMRVSVLCEYHRSFGSLAPPIVSPTRRCQRSPSGLSYLVPDFEITHLYISPGHNFFGHEPGKPSGNPVREVPSIWCVAGKGIEGDRFFGYKESYKGQITFFEEETYNDLCAQLEIWDRPPSVFRRNVITRGVRLNELIGHEFTVGDVRLLGTEESRPCFWMDQAFGPGAKAALKGRGGLRAQVLSTGRLTVSPSLSEARKELGARS